MCRFSERYDDCVVPWSLYLHTIVRTNERAPFRRLEIAPKEEQVLKVYNVFPEVFSDFFRFSHDVKQRGTEFEGRP